MCVGVCLCVCVLHVCGKCVCGYMWIGGLDGCGKGAHHHACMRVCACVRGVCAHVGSCSESSPATAAAAAEYGCPPPFALPGALVCARQHHYLDHAIHPHLLLLLLLFLLLLHHRVWKVECNRSVALLPVCV